MPKKGVCKAIFRAVLALHSTNLYCCRWIREDVLIQLIQQHGALCNLDGCVIDTRLLRSTFGRGVFSYVNQLDTPNDTGIYRKKAYERDSRCGNKVVKEFYFYFTRDSNCIPTNNTQWKIKAVKTKSQLGPTRRSARLRQKVQEEEPVRKRLKRQNNSNLHSQSPDTNNSNNCYVLPTSLSQQLQNHT